MNKYIESDSYRWTGKPLSFQEQLRLKRIPQYKMIYVKRKCDQYRNKNKILFGFYTLVYNHLKVKLNVDLPASVKMGYGFKLEHIGGITINPKTVFGNNVNIYNGVTIGIEKRGKRKGTPVIGNQVWIGSNAIVVGGVKVGNNVLIAPGSFVNFDIPSDSLVIGNPGKIIEKENACDKYISNIFELD